MLLHFRTKSVAREFRRTFVISKHAIAWRRPVFACVERGVRQCRAVYGLIGIIPSDLSFLLSPVDTVLNQRCIEKKFIIFSGSMSSLEALSGFKLELDLAYNILKDYEG